MVCLETALGRVIAVQMSGMEDVWMTRQFTDLLIRSRQRKYTQYRGKGNQEKSRKTQERFYLLYMTDHQMGL